MFRSLVFLKEEEIIKFDSKILEADVFVFDQNAALKFLNRTDKENSVLVDKLILNKKSLFVTINNLEIKSDYKALDQIDAKLINGVFLKNTTLKTLNKVTLKLREYEANLRIVFGSLSIISAIDSLEAFNATQKLSSYSRVVALYLDSESINRDLFIGNTNSLNEMEYLKEKIVIDNAKHDKFVIDSLENQEDDNIDYLRRIGFNGKAVNEASNIKRINASFSPNEEEISQALNIVNASYTAVIEKEKYAIYEGKKINQVNLKKARNILERAKTLGLFDKDIPPMVKKNKIVVKKNPPMKFYSFGEEVANAISHGFGVAFGIMMLALIVIKGISLSQVEYIVGGIIFGSAIILLYLASTIYHSLSLSVYAKQIFRRFDHSSIYILIAGSYTPFLLILLNDTKAVIVTVFMWIIAITGVVLKVFWINKFQKIHLGLYIALGWLPAMFFGANIMLLGPVGIALLVAGGLAYTIGVIFYALKLFKFTHMVWHLFCILGTLLHFLTVYIYL